MLYHRDWLFWKYNIAIGHNLKSLLLTVVGDELPLLNSWRIYSERIIQ
jgi:hypothetical protein